MPNVSRGIPIQSWSWKCSIITIFMRNNVRYWRISKQFVVLNSLLALWRLFHCVQFGLILTNAYYNCFILWDSVRYDEYSKFERVAVNTRSYKRSSIQIVRPVISPFNTFSILPVGTTSKKNGLGTSTRVWTGCPRWHGAVGPTWAKRSPQL